jgi:hypothetical protein
LAVSIVLALAVPAAAQPGGGADASERAASLFDEGKRHFDIGEYAAAITSWKQSYLVSSEPLLLFNIAQAFRLSGNCAQANRFYLNYKRAAQTIENRAELEQAMALCAGVEAATGDSDASSPTPAPAGPPTPAVPAAPPRVPRTDDGRGERIAGYALLGVGITAGVVAVVSAFQASGDAHEISSAAAGSTWTGMLATDQSAGQTAQTRARVVGAIGGAALLGGGVLWWLGHRSSSRIELAIAPSRTHTEVSVSCAF